MPRNRLLGTYPCMRAMPATATRVPAAARTATNVCLERLSAMCSLTQPLAKWLRDSCRSSSLHPQGGDAPYEGEDAEEGEPRCRETEGHGESVGDVQVGHAERDEREQEG